MSSDGAYSIDRRLSDWGDVSPHTRCRESTIPRKGKHDPAAGKSVVTRSLPIQHQLDAEIFMLNSSPQLASEASQHTINELQGRSGTPHAEESAASISSWTDECIQLRWEMHAWNWL